MKLINTILKLNRSGWAGLTFCNEHTQKILAEKITEILHNFISIGSHFSAQGKKNVTSDGVAVRWKILVIPR